MINIFNYTYDKGNFSNSNFNNRQMNLIDQIF